MKGKLPGEMGHWYSCSLLFNIRWIFFSLPGYELQCPDQVPWRTHPQLRTRTAGISIKIVHHVKSRHMVLIDIDVASRGPRRNQDSISPYFTPMFRFDSQDSFNWLIRARAMRSDLLQTPDIYVYLYSFQYIDTTAMHLAMKEHIMSTIMPPSWPKVHTFRNLFYTFVCMVTINDKRSFYWPADGR